MSHKTQSNQNVAVDAYVFSPSFQQEMSPVLDPYIGDLPIQEFHTSSAFAGTLFPALDLAETANPLAISEEKPSLKIEGLNIAITGEVLALKGEKDADQQEIKDNYHLTARPHGRFCRQFQLGFIPEESAAPASFADGVLKYRSQSPQRPKFLPENRH